MKKPRLLALDLDGTLLNSQSAVSKHNQEAIKAAVAAGVEVVISTGRPFIGVPRDLMAETGMRYAITTNGSAIYLAAERKCIYSQCMDKEKLVPVLQRLLHRHMHFDSFIDGEGYTDRRSRAVIDELNMPPAMRYYIRETRHVVEDISAFVEKSEGLVQKVTMNFPGDETNPVRIETYEELSGDPYFRLVSGGFNNLEITRSDVSKAKALSYLCEYLGFPLQEAVAMGDTENDMDMLAAAGVGIAMGNAAEEIKEAADMVTLTNDEDGVAAVIESFLTEDLA